MSNIRERRARRAAIKKNDELYDSIGVAPKLTIDAEDDTPISEHNIEESTEFKRVDRNRKKLRPLMTSEYNYQTMAVEYSQANVAQQLGNYRQSMEFLANILPSYEDKIVERLQKVIYDFPNIDISSFVNRENARLYSWIIQQMTHAFGEKYLGSVYVLGGGMGILPAMLFDTKLRFENIHKFDTNGYY